MRDIDSIVAALEGRVVKKMNEIMPNEPSRGPGAVNLIELLSIADVGFLSAAYSQLLQRPLDKHGRVLWESKLSEGRLSKLEVLFFIRYSKEGRRVGVKVPGLLSRFCYVRAASVPFFGGFFRFAYKFILLFRSLDRLERLELGQREVSSRVGQLEAEVSEFKRVWLNDRDHTLIGECHGKIDNFGLVLKMLEDDVRNLKVVWFNK